MTLLGTAAHYIGHGHTGNAHRIHGVLHPFQLGRVKEHHHFAELSVRFGGISLYRNSLFYRCSRQTAFRYRNGSKAADGHKVRIGRGQVVLGGVQPLDLFFRADPQTHGLVQNKESDGQGHCRPTGHSRKPD